MTSLGQRSRTTVVPLGAPTMREWRGLYTIGRVDPYSLALRVQHTLGRYRGATIGGPLPNHPPLTSDD